MTARDGEPANVDRAQVAALGDQTGMDADAMFGAASCPICHDSGIITRPYIAGVASVISLCGCPAGMQQKWAFQRALQERNGK